jgi:thioesterase domain-containing protein
VPAPYSGSTVVVRASDPVAGAAAAPAVDLVAAWRPFLTEPPELHWLPGDHFSLLRPPRVEGLARLIEQLPSPTHNKLAIESANAPNIQR